MSHKGYTNSMKRFKSKQIHLSKIKSQKRKRKGNNIGDHYHGRNASPSSRS